MGSLFSGLRIASNAIQAFQKAINSTSNNVTNATTPGYAAQRAQLSADSFDVSSAVGGGVHYAGTSDTRDSYAERNVRQWVSQQGEAAQRVRDYSRLEAILPVDGKTGVTPALNDFFQAFSSLTTTPNDSTLRQLALNKASIVAQQFQQSMQSLDQVTSGVLQDISDQQNQVNQLGQQIADINRQYQQNMDSVSDPGLNAQMAQALQKLSQYGDVTALQEQDGTMSVTFGQAMLVSGSHAMPLQWVSGPSHMVLQDSLGNDMSNSLRSGSLSELLKQQNQVLPDMESNLNQLAQTFATAVNNTLSTGVDSTNSAPTQNLFNFDPVAGAARTLSVNPLTPGDLALADPTAPGGNAVAVKIAGLQKAALISGQTLSQNYGSLASQVGQMLSNAQNDQNTADSLTAQAISVRADGQGVDLDAEAVNLLQYQRAYDATSQFVKVINQLTQDVIDMLR